MFTEVEVNSGGYLPSCEAARLIIVLVYTTQAEELAAQRVTLFVKKIPTKANERARKVLFTCVVYTKRRY